MAVAINYLLLFKHSTNHVFIFDDKYSHLSSKTEQEKGCEYQRKQTHSFINTPAQLLIIFVILEYNNMTKWHVSVILSYPGRLIYLKFSSISIRLNRLASKAWQA